MIKWPQCVYKDSTVNGFENCEYKIIHSLEQFLELGPEWGKKQREEIEKVEVKLAVTNDETEENPVFERKLRRRKRD